MLLRWILSIGFVVSVPGILCASGSVDTQSIRVCLEEGIGVEVNIEKCGAVYHCSVSFFEYTPDVAHSTSPPVASSPVVPTPTHTNTLHVYLQSVDILRTQCVGDGRSARGPPVLS
ncbi:MAG: hypothetical protein CL920_14575 [Deltaproteobacteria bacterium]|nr:hypothetical protein [Deltaproteobacteria bacterium]MBU49909.1 hypothetical protein [Deltaproteobacteria bacterium]